MTRNNEVSVVKRENTLPTVQTDSHETYASPFTDVYETPDAYVLMIDLPGVVKEAINVTMDDARLIVRAKIGPYHSERSTLLVKELTTTGYYRVFNLGAGIDRERIDAQYEHGVLLIRLFKNEKTKLREIHIK